METLPEEQKITGENASQETKSKRRNKRNKKEGRIEGENKENEDEPRAQKYNPQKFFSDSFVSFLVSSALLPEAKSIKEAKKLYTCDLMVKAISNVFERHLPSNSRYTEEDMELLTKLFRLFAKIYDEPETIKEVFRVMSRVEDLIPAAMINPKTKRNIISLVYCILEPLMKSNPSVFFDEFCTFFVLMTNDLRAQAEESLTENNPLFMENFQHCYSNIPYMILLFSDNPETYEKIIELLTTEFKNVELSIYQSYILFTCMSMLARKRNLECKDDSFFNVEVTTKKYSLSICVDGSFKTEAKSLIFVLRRAIDTNTISFEIKGRYNVKYKVDKQVNTSYVRSLLDINFGVNKDNTNRLKVLDKSKTGEMILYAQVAFYSILCDAITGNKLDQKYFICDTLLNLAIVNNPNISKYAVETLVSCSLFADNFFQNILFARLATKMVEFDDSLREAEREKSSDYVLHPHVVMNLRHLITQVLVGQQLTPFSKSLIHTQSSSLTNNGLIHLLICINSPAVYNFREKGNKKCKIIKNYLLCIKKHYEYHGKSLTDILSNIKYTLISKISTRFFIMSEKLHMRIISVNICGSTCWFSQEFCEAMCETFKLKTVLEQVTKCILSREKFKEQYAHIAFYDMNHIADSTAGLMKVFENKEKSIKNSLAVDEPEEEVKIVKESKDAPKNAKDMNMLLMGGGGKKKPTKGKKPVKEKEVKPVKEKKSGAEQKSEPQQPLVEESKDARILRDLRTVNSFLDKAFDKSCTYLSSICSIYELASKEKSDKILNQILYQNIHIFIELLRYPASNFIVKGKIQNLLTNNSGENGILKIRDCLIECLLMSARLLNNVDLSKDDVDKQYRVFFKIIGEDSFDFSKLGKGIVRLILTNIKFAIKHSEISHTFKENAVTIAMKILSDSTEYHTLDMVKIAETLLKQDYIAKCGYKFLRALMERIDDKERLLLCNQLFDFNTLQLADFFKIIYDYDKAIPRSESFEVQLWIMQNEEEPTNKAAQRLWNKYYSNIDIISHSKEKKTRVKLYTAYATDRFGEIRKCTVNSFIAAINIDRTLLFEYIDSIQEVINNCLTPEQATEQFRFFAYVITSVAHLVDSSQLEKLFEFIVYDGYFAEGENISTAYEKCGINICIEQGQLHSTAILKILKGYLLNPKAKRPGIDVEKEYLVLNLTLLLISSLAKYFDKSNESTLDIYERIIEMLNMPNNELKKSISKCISPLAKLLEDKSKKFLKQLIAMLLKTKDLSTLTGAAFAIAGIVKGLGIKTIEDFSILKTLEENANDKTATSHKKVALLNCYEAFATTLGKVFEIFLEKIVPQVLESLADSKDIVRNAGQKALEAIMRNVSGHCVKRLITTVFLKGIEEANWRTKLGQIEALCSMAMFAPNQLAVHLPQIINSLRTILLDTHPKVQEAGQDALKTIVSAMRNQGKLNALAILEVHSEQLAKSSATENLKKALDHLLDTTFVHSLDEHSLALLMPLIRDGLEAVNRKIQIKALRIVGHICSIMTETSNLYPYIKDFAPIMVNLLLTVHPKLRSASCKALAGFVRGLKLQKQISMCKWICKQLREISITDSKNVQIVYTEVEYKGKTAEDVWKDEVAEIEKLCVSDSSNKRVAGVTLLVDFHRFISCFKKDPNCKIDFTDYANKIIPMFEEALLDQNEDVRAAAVKGCNLAIYTFGEGYYDLIFRQLLRGFRHGNYWIRYHTIVLISKLLNLLGGNIHKVKKGEDNSQVEQFICYEEIISCIYFLNFDVVERVSFTASSAWQLFVEKRLGRLIVAPFDNDPPTLSQLVFDIVEGLSSEYQEVNNSAIRCINSLIGKIFVKLMDRSLDMLDESLKGNDAQKATKISNYFFHLISACDENVSKYRDRVEETIRQMIIHEFHDVRKISSEVFKALKRAVQDEDFVRKFIKSSFCNYDSHADDVHLEKKMTFLEALIADQYLNVSPILTAICLSPKEDSESQYYNRAKLLRLLGNKFLPDASKAIILIFNLILDGKALLEIEETSKYVANDTYISLGNSKDVIDELIYAAKSLVLKIPNERIYEWHEFVEELYKRCVQNNKITLYIVFISQFIHHPKFQSEGYIDVYLKNIMNNINNEDPDVLEKFIDCIESGITFLDSTNPTEEYLSRDWQNSFCSIFRSEIEDIMGLDEYEDSFASDSLQLFKYPRGVDIVIKIFINCLLTGKTMVRTDASFNIGALARFTPIECYSHHAIKMAGALIRIVNDKFDDNLKVLIFRALRRIFEKAGPIMKPMLAPLKTTFNKYLKNEELAQEIKDEMEQLQKVVESTLSTKKLKSGK